MQTQPLKRLFFWSDGCGYQNRNAVLSNAYLHLAERYDIVVEQGFLVVGHTQMGYDSMHSTIGRKVIGDIYAPHDYRVIFGHVRIQPSPYQSYLSLCETLTKYIVLQIV